MSNNNNNNSNNSNNINNSNNNNRNISINLQNNSGVISISSYVISYNLFNNIRNNVENTNSNNNNNSNNFNNNVNNIDEQNLPLDFLQQYYNYYNYNNGLSNTGPSINNFRTSNMRSIYNSYPYQNFMLDSHSNLDEEIVLNLPSLNDIINSYINKNYNKLNEEEFNKYTEVINDIVEECPICYNETENNIKIKKCNHIFCQTCSKTWFTKHKNTCPICRINIVQFDNVEDEMETGNSNNFENNEFQYEYVNENEIIFENNETNETNETNENNENIEIDYLIEVD